MTKELTEDEEMRASLFEMTARERDKLEDEVVALDSSVAQINEMIKDLRGKVQGLNEDYDFQWKDRQAKLQRHARLNELTRDLKRGREGWPFLSDKEYESRMTDAESEILEILDLSTPSKYLESAGY